MTELCIKLKTGTKIRGFFNKYSITDNKIHLDGYEDISLDDIYLIAEREPDEQTATLWSLVFKSDDYVNETQDIF